MTRIITDRNANFTNSFLPLDPCSSVISVVIIFRLSGKRTTPSAVTSGIGLDWETSMTLFPGASLQADGVRINGVGGGIFSVGIENVGCTFGQACCHVGTMSKRRTTRLW
jgi:hypothetical protein